MRFSSIGKCNYSHMVLLDTPLYVDAVTDEGKLPWHKYLKGSIPKTAILTTLPPNCLEL
jgi:hypothetical protein